MEKKREITWTVDALRAFESEVIDKYKGANIRGPIHLSHGNEKALIDAFQYIDKDDWVFSTWRNHYHALLHGIDRDWLMDDILSGRSINISNGDHKFHTSAIVGGIISIATGTALALKRKGSSERVYCFIGDMAHSTGVFHESYKYATANSLPITFVIEDNGLSTNTPTQQSWWTDSDIKFYETKYGNRYSELVELDVLYQRTPYEWYYQYEREYPHVGIGEWIYF